MTSGTKLTEAEYWAILRLHAAGLRWSEISRELAVDYRSVRSAICDAARAYYRIAKPHRIDELADFH